MFDNNMYTLVKKRKSDFSFVFREIEIKFFLYSSLIIHEFQFQLPICQPKISYLKGRWVIGANQSV